MSKIKLSDIPADSFELVAGENMEVLMGAGWIPEDVEVLRAFYSLHEGLFALVIVERGLIFAAFGTKGGKVEIEATWLEFCEWHLNQIDRLNLWAPADNMLPKQEE